MYSVRRVLLAHLLAVVRDEGRVPHPFRPNPNRGHAVTLGDALKRNVLKVLRRLKDIFP